MIHWGLGFRVSKGFMQGFVFPELIPLEKNKCLHSICEPKLEIENPAMPSASHLRIACSLLPLCLTALLSASAQAESPSLVSNLFISKSISRAPGTAAQGQLALINQTYSDQTIKKHLLIDVSVAIPNASLGILALADAPKSSLIASFSKSGAANPYAECTLEPRVMQGRSASFSVGLKSTGEGALIRWGVCKDFSIPGYSSIFPDIQTGDSVLLKTKDGQIIGQFLIPAPTASSAANLARQNAVLSLLTDKQFKSAQ